jgi:DNA-binding NtrC family response regulator
MSKILLADDEANFRRVLRDELAEAGHDVEEAESGARALEILAAGEFDVLLLDLNMPRLGGMDVLERLRRLDVATEVIVLTGHGTVSLAVAAMKLGADNFLTKPFTLAELLAVIEKAVEKKRLRSENLLLRTRVERQDGPAELICRSPALLAILETVRTVAASDFPLLIEGESGVGKELVARALHRSSPRGAGPFIPLNCGAIPESLIESELFGHEKGAFTGAQARKVGLLEVAHRGTLFLDEIGDLPPATQVKFLRVLETGSFFRVGGVKEVTVDVRCASASNRDIKAEVAAGRFRADLYYRISTFTILVPPLRERREDIPALIEHFVRINPHYRKVRFSPGALAALTAYPWPGNVRELQNIVYRTLLLSKGAVINAADLPADLRKVAGAASGKLADVEREHILKVMRESGGQRGKAAEILGIDPKTLYRKLAELEAKE